MKAKIRISKTVLRICIALLASIKIDSLQYILPSRFATFFNYWLPMMVFAFYLVILVQYRHGVSKIMKLIGGFFAVFFVCTIIKNTSGVQALMAQLASLLAVTVVTEYYMQKAPYRYFQAVLCTLFVLILIDLGSILLFPNGLYSTISYTECWFLGYKTSRMRIATMPIIMVAAILSIKKRNKLDIKFWLISTVALVDTYLSKNTGGVITIGVMLCLLLLIYGSRRENVRLTIMKLFNFRFCVILIIAITVVVNIFLNLSFLTPIINNIPGKEMTMWGRIRIWTECLNLFKSSPIIGNGYVLGSKFVELVGFNAATQPHSFMLAILVYMGIVGLLLFFVILNRVLSYVDRKQPYATTPICATYLICMLFHGIISMHLFAPFMFASMIILYYMNSLDGGVGYSIKTL